MASNDLLSQIIPQSVATNIYNDTMQFGLALLLARLVLQKNILDKEWLIKSLLVLLGFAAYQLTINRFINTSMYVSGNLKLAIDDVLKFGTMLLVSRYLSSKSLSDDEWMKEVGFMLTGFVSYSLVTQRLLNNNVINVNTLTPNLSLAISDGLKFSTMYLVSRWLSGNEFSREWMLESAGYTVGVMAYDYFSN